MRSHFTVFVGSVFALVIVLTADAGRAELATYEGFDYSDIGSPLLGKNGGTGFASAWEAGGFNASVHDNYQIAAGSLTFGNLLTSGNSVITDKTDAIAGISRQLDQTYGTGDTVYISFLVEPKGTLGEGAFGGFFGLYLDSVQPEPDLFIGRPGQSNQYVIENRGGTLPVASNLIPEVDTTAFLVVKAELKSGIDKFTLYANPTPGEPEPDSGFVKEDIDLQQFDALVIYSTGAFQLDEIRVGSTFEAVSPVPEPSSLALAVIGVVSAIGIVRRRRRRR